MTERKSFQPKEQPSNSKSTEQARANRSKNLMPDILRHRNAEKKMIDTQSDHLDPHPQEKHELPKKLTSEGVQARFPEMEKYLQSSEISKHAMQKQKEHNTLVELNPNDASSFDPEKNKIVLNSNKSDGQAALEYIHEMNHAEAFNEKKSANARELFRKNPLTARNEYIDRKIEEEVEGTVRALEAKKEMQRNGCEFTEQYKLEDEYDEAFQQDGPEKAREQVKQAFNNGDVRTSTNNLPYRSFLDKRFNKER